MTDLISPKYLMKLTKEVYVAILLQYPAIQDVYFYIKKWHKEDDYNNWQNFGIEFKGNKEIDLLSTLHNIDGETMLKIAVEMGVDTPDFIPSIATFRNEIKSDYKTASAIFENAFKQIETHLDIAIGLANSALESIIKEIFKDEKLKSKPKEGKTLYDLTSELLKEFQLFPNSDIPSEIKKIGSSLLSASQNIEKLRSTKTNFHGKASEDYIINDPIYTYFVVNSVATIGLFLKSYYKIKFPSLLNQANINPDDLPF